MNEEIFSKILPQEHLNEYLKSGFRQDKRECGEHRPIYIEFYKVDPTLINMMLNIGGTICQCVLKLNRVTEKIAGGRKDFFEPIKIKVKFSERQNYGEHEFDKATFNYSLNNFVLKNYSFDKFFEKSSDMEKIQLSFDLMVFTNLGNETESLWLSAMTSLYKLLGQNNLPQMKKSNIYFPVSHQMISRKYLVIDPSKSEEEAGNSVKLFFLINLNNYNFCFVKNTGSSINIDTIKECIETTKKLIDQNFTKQYMDFIQNPEEKLLKAFFN